MARRAKVGLPLTMVLLAAGLLPQARAAEDAVPGGSPAHCGAQDTPESGVQGDIPRGDQDSGRAAQGYNCGLSLVSEFAGGNAVQGYGDCVYVRDGGMIRVVDTSDPANPVELGSVINHKTGRPQVGGGSEGSETMRVMVTPKTPTRPRRALLASSQSVYDITNCRNPVLKGVINWQTAAFNSSGDSHDIRVSHDGTRIYASTTVKEVDISNLDDSSTWTPVDHKCGLAAQANPLHGAIASTGASQCDDPAGVGYSLPPAFAHGPDDNADGSRLYVGSQTAAFLADAEDDTLRILDMTGETPRILDELPGPGHSVDWFRTADGREFILHANEIVAAPESSCLPRTRPSSLGWAHEAFITEVTGDELRRASRVELAISTPEHCDAKMSSRQNTAVAYHSVDNPYRATFAMVSMGNAGLRVFDIRNPDEPTEVAYFNRGAMQHAGVTYYDARRGLLFAAGGSSVQVLEMQPQVYQALGLKKPTDPAYPRYGTGRPALPVEGPGSGAVPVQFNAAIVQQFCTVPQPEPALLS